MAREAWFNKAAGIVSYGSVGGARAAEHLRGIFSEQSIAHVRTHPAFLYLLILKMAKHSNRQTCMKYRK